MTLNINSFYYNSSSIKTTQVQLRKAFTASNQVQVTTDTFSYNSELSPYLSEAKIKELIQANPKISKILRENNIKQEINIKELQNLANGHLKATKNITAGIINNLSPEIKSTVNRSALLEAAIFHDFGKVLIPAKILNKPAKLNGGEKSLMQLHSELGYELLKTQNLSPKALELIKYHHQTPDYNGYPIVDVGFEYSIEQEILTLADKYSALVEKRSYKPALSKNEALAVLKEEHPNSPALVALEKFVCDVG